MLGARLVSATTVREFCFQEVPPNLVVEQLAKLDEKLTPSRGLRRLEKDGTLKAVSAPLGEGDALLFIHGTFSKCEVFLEELGATKEGKDFLVWARGKYKHILTFDHPTLCVSPILNALDLEADLRGHTGTVDVIAHSRGGLVCAWWLRTGKRKVNRVICAGSPLEGTSLAAPARIKNALDYLANVAGAISTGARGAGMFIPPIAPLMEAAAGLVSVLGGALSVGARTPLVDAGVAIVPGLVAQSRVSNNQELLRLQASQWPTKAKIHAIYSDFEPGDPDAPAWQFWRRWNRPLLAIADTVADRIFQAPNDLVVDNECTHRAFDVLPGTQLKPLAANNRVHHCNYFAQRDIVLEIRGWLAAVDKG
jgi:pimeloyl-ACP methyl ester carboxylesterase